MKKPTLTMAQWAKKLKVSTVRARLLAPRVPGAGWKIVGGRANRVVPFDAEDPRKPWGRPPEK